tara:strand:- start:47 stop:199 length:153 start_codon:yes stop_codon:yes gene_type:complete
MNYKVKVKGGVSIFMDKELAEKCAEKNKTKVEVILDRNRVDKNDSELKDK